MVGLGTQDSFEEAEQFRERHDTATPLMIWDETFQTWNHFEISSQPSAVMVDSDGQELGRWRGFPDEIAQLADSL